MMLSFSSAGRAVVRQLYAAELMRDAPTDAASDARCSQRPRRTHDDL